MDERTLRQDQIARYLEALELSQQEPSLPALTRLVRAHLEHVPFENVSKLYYAERFGLKELPGLDRFLEGLHLYHFGGTCYANNSTGFFSRSDTTCDSAARTCQIPTSIS